MKKKGKEEGREGRSPARGPWHWLGQTGLTPNSSAPRLPQQAERRVEQALVPRSHLWGTWGPPRPADRTQAREP